MSRQTVRALARSKEVFYASVAGELFSGLFMGPIRGQMTRCILPTEIGKVAPVPASASKSCIRIASEGL